MTTTILIVTNAVDGRASTDALHGMVEVLRRRPDTEVEVLVLRRSRDRRAPWPGARVVDDLRTWLPAALIERLGGTIVADWLRGRRLRWWMRGSGPDIVLLDDGIGFRVIEHLRRRPAIVARRNPSSPADVDLEPPPLADPDVVVVAIDTDPGPLPAGVPVIREQELLDPALATERCGEAYRTGYRTRLDLPLDVPLVAGWGFDGWLDGPDVFVRVLWALRERHGSSAHGVWFGDTPDHDREQLEQEARRCGLADAYHLRPYTGSGEVPPEAFCADAVLLPTRLALVREHLSPAIASGLIVTTFEAADLDDPAIWPAPDLDVEAAAQLLATALGTDRAERSRQALEELDADRWVASIVDAASGRG